MTKQTSFLSSLNRQQKWMLFLAIFVALIELGFEFSQLRPGIYFTKPLVLVLLIQVWLFQPPEKGFFFYLRIFVTALLFSLVGDSLLLAPEGSLFVYGLCFFLFAQIFYTLGFWLLSGHHRRDLILLFPPLIFLALMMFLLLPTSEKFRIPIIVYGLAISAMLWRSLCIGFNPNFSSSKRLLVSLGAFLFVFSDSIIAWNVFVERLEYARFLIMPTYFGAQILFTYALIAIISRKMHDSSSVLDMES